MFPMKEDQRDELRNPESCRVFGKIKESFCSSFPGIIEKALQCLSSAMILMFCNLRRVHILFYFSILSWTEGSNATLHLLAVHILSVAWELCTQCVLQGHCPGYLGQS